MKIFEEIGPKRLGKYFIFSLWQVIFDCLVFSPLRVIWLRIGGASLGANCVIDKIDFINLDRNGLSGLKIGSECFLGRGALLDLAGKVIIEDQVTVSARASVLSHFSVGFSNHPLLKKYPKFIGTTVLKQGCFIGLGGIILAGLTIGEKSLVAAGAVVTKDTLKDSVVTGVPAKQAKRK